MLYRFLNYTISYKIIFGDKNQKTKETQTLQMSMFNKILGGGYIRITREYDDGVFKRETHPAIA